MAETRIYKNTRWVLKRTRKGDSLAKLAKVYSTPTNSISAQDIVLANDVKWNNNAINQWLLSLGGKCVPYKAGQPKVAGCPDGGWAVFTDATSIYLPDRPRADGEPTPVPMQPPMMSQTGGFFDALPWWAWAGLIGGGFLVFRASTKKRKKKAGPKKSVPAPVVF